MVLVATDMVNQRVMESIEKLESEIANLTALKASKEGKWSTTRLQEVQNDIDIATENITRKKELIEQDSPYKKQKLNQMIKRKADGLIEASPTKRRRLGAGPTEKIDSECEEFIANAIETKATYHGRRHDTVMYTNRRVKRRDLLQIANQNLLERGKVTIRSSVTAWNRSRPRNKRSIQSKRHRGNALFCSKKPPKTEDKFNENTHYQRAHALGVQTTFFGLRSTLKPFCFFLSMDDKAYLRPGTSEGFNKTRNTRILSHSAEEKSKKLPKYDWPESQVYITPSTHRVLFKDVVEMNREARLVTKEDRHFVFVRPKVHVDS